DYLNPDFTLVGEFDDKSGSMLEYSYAMIMENNPPCKRMSIENAELAKVALNTYVTTKITYANMLAEVCELLPGGDVDVVTDAIGADTRVGKKYLKGALGYGGPCFPRDNVALSFFAREIGRQASLAETTHQCNRSLVEKVLRNLSGELHDRMSIAVLGLAYKPYSHVIEESQGMYLAKALIQSGYRVVAFDPLANESAAVEIGRSVVLLDSMEECIAQADVVFITTPDPLFKTLTVDHFPGKKTIVVDFWRILDPSVATHPKVRYIPLGRSIRDDENSERLAKLWNHSFEE
ncbi:MAG: UDP binding domain-containing protein, partial [Candidatus Latescibacterota bacterium]